MPVSLEQWRASVGAINAAGTRVLARGLQRRGGDDGFLQLLLFLLVMCCCIGVWLVVKWSMSLTLLLKGYRRRYTCKQLAFLVVGGGCGLLSAFAKHGGVVSLDYTSSENFNAPSFLDGSCQSSNAAFRVAVMDALLYLSGDVEKNPGPLQLFDLVPSNVDRLQSLLSLHEVDVTGALRRQLRAPYDSRQMMWSQKETCCTILQHWLEHPSPGYEPSWLNLGHALAAIGCVGFSQEIFNAIPSYQAGQQVMGMQSGQSATQQGGGVPSMGGSMNIGVGGSQMTQGQLNQHGLVGQRSGAGSMMGAQQAGSSVIGGASMMVGGGSMMPGGGPMIGGNQGGVVGGMGGQQQTGASVMGGQSRSSLIGGQGGSMMQGGTSIQGVLGGALGGGSMMQAAGSMMGQQGGMIGGQQQQQQGKQAQIEKLLHILQLLAKSNQQQQEQILQRMTHITAEHKQQLLQKAQLMKQQMMQSQPQQQPQQQPQAFGTGYYM